MSSRLTRQEWKIPDTRNPVEGTIPMCAWGSPNASCPGFVGNAGQKHPDNWEKDKESSEAVPIFATMLPDTEIQTN